RALRGAITVDSDTPEQVSARTCQLLEALIEANAVAHEDLISILFTTTPDVVSMFPATAARSMGLGDVPLLCASEIDVPGATPLCIRVLMHLTTDRPRDQLHHVYLEGARALRD
ncbi:MAG TPA: chorismate mutase, partial [Acidimicrobiaceae bacterium]|nr:chorismate mutase [Acidimicrobiaceae bacterium]